jgi:hypothetical protein
LDDILLAARTGGRDTLKAAADIIMDGALRKAFEMGWLAHEHGMTLSDALALYDKSMSA